MRLLILVMMQCPGDATVMSAVLRDLHLAFPGQFLTDVRTACDALFENNPYITKLREGDPGVEIIKMQYPLVHQSNRPYHFLHGFTQFLEQKLDLGIPVTKFSGDIYLSDEEKNSPPVEGVDLPERFWILVAGGKRDFTAKWPNPATLQDVVDHFQGTITFVQVGEAGHCHPQLTGVINLIGKTSLRQFVRLMHYAEGVLCPVTFAMHLAAAVETRPGFPRNRPCVVLAGGREPPHWEGYPFHQFITNIGMLICCETGACWKSRCQLVGDGDEKDRRNVCEQPVQVTPDLRIARCQVLITSADVIRRIDMYREGGVMRPESIISYPLSQSFVPLTLPQSPTPSAPATPPRPAIEPPSVPRKSEPEPRRPARQAVLIEDRHGLGDSVQLTLVLRHLRSAHSDWEIDVAALRGKHSLFNGLCRRVLVLNEGYRRSDYQIRFTLDWHECRASEAHFPSTKATRCLQEVFHLPPQPALCRYEIRLSDAVREPARRYLEALCGPPSLLGRYRAVLIHYEGNTSTDRKNLSHPMIQRVCETVLQAEHVPVILDWDHRSPLPDGVTIHCPDRNHPLWQGTGTGDGAMIAALIEACTLMIGIDSGPLHVAGATSTPTLGVWTRHHPVHFYDLSENVLHLVPRDHASLAAGPAAVAYFEAHYRHQTYETLETELLAQVDSHLKFEI